MDMKRLCQPYGYSRQTVISFNSNVSHMYIGQAVYLISSCLWFHKASFSPLHKLRWIWTTSRSSQIRPDSCYVRKLSTKRKVPLRTSTSTRFKACLSVLQASPCHSSRLSYLWFSYLYQLYLRRFTRRPLWRFSLVI